MGSSIRFGVEEEFLVVDPVSRAVVPRAAVVVERARERLGDRVCGEITELQLETRTEPCLELDDLYHQLVEARDEVAVAAAAEGVRVVATGSAVVGPIIPPPITRGPRQDRGNETFRGLHDEVSVCAVHVHVELPERERAVLVSNHLRPYLPVLIALTANSPYWAERDTGYASWRSVSWGRWPVAGPPPYLTSAAHYDEVVATMLGAGALVDKGTIFWDIRPSAHKPTLEVRVADVPLAAEESALLAALVRGLVAGILRAVDAGDKGPVVPAELLRLAYWRAARDGMAGDGVEATSGRLVPAPALARRLLHAAAPGLGESELSRVTGWLDRLVAGGDGATRQRRAAGEGGLRDVVDHLIAHTAPSAARHRVPPAGEPVR